MTNLKHDKILILTRQRELKKKNCKNLKITQIESVSESPFLVAHEDVLGVKLNLI